MTDNQSQRSFKMGLLSPFAVALVPSTGLQVVTKRFDEALLNFISYKTPRRL